jgi:hypothetical protein
MLALARHLHGELGEIEVDRRSEAMDDRDAGRG